MRKINLIIAITFLFLSPVNNLTAQSNIVTISIINIEYESTQLNLLKEAIKKSTSAEAIKFSFADNTATFDISYSGSAEALWATVPAVNKKVFKLNSLSEKNIALDYILAAKTPSTGKLVNNQEQHKKTETTKDDNNCSSCVYYNFCNYDGTKSFQGKTYYGINYDGAWVYYRFENGDLISKSVIYDSWGNDVGYENKILLKCKAPKGTKWENESFLYTRVPIKKYYEIVEKGPLTIDGNNYKDAIKISVATPSNKFGNTELDEQFLNMYKKSKAYKDGFIVYKNGIIMGVEFEYYVNGLGLIKVEKADERELIEIFMKGF